MTENKNTLLVHKSREIILDILNQRGFKTEDYKGFSISEIHSLINNNQLDILLTHKDNNKKVYIKYYNLEKTIRPTNIHEIVESLFNIEQILQKSDDLIIIIKDEPNDTLQKILQSIYEHDKIFISLINIERLQFNILNHSLVPPHITLTEDEANVIRNKYNIILNENHEYNDSSFPTIGRFDPVATVIGLRPGELCEINRTSKTAINSKFYRICSH